MEQNRSQELATKFLTTQKLGDKYNPNLRYFLVVQEYFWNLLSSCYTGTKSMEVKLLQHTL